MNYTRKKNIKLQNCLGRNVSSNVVINSFFNTTYLFLFLFVLLYCLSMKKTTVGQWTFRRYTIVTTFFMSASNSYNQENNKKKAIHTLKKIFVDWYTPKIRWSLKNQFICVTNPGINSFSNKTSSKVFLPLQTDKPLYWFLHW